MLPLHYMQGWTAHHYIGAKAVQELVAPNSRVRVLPNEPDSVTLDDEDKRKMEMGISVADEYQMRYLEAQDLGKTDIEGTSYGGLTALRIASRGSDILNLAKVSADEMPHKDGRDASGVRKDFGQSSGIPRLRRSIKAAEIPALSESMSPLRMTKDLARFAWRSFATEAGRLGMQDMAGTQNVYIAGAVHELGGNNVNLGYVDGSNMFHAGDVDLTSDIPIHSVPARENPRVINYSGEDFYAHAFVDNPILRAAIIREGLRH